MFDLSFHHFTLLILKGIIPLWLLPSFPGGLYLIPPQTCGAFSCYNKITSYVNEGVSALPFYATVFGTGFTIPFTMEMCEL